MYASCMHVYMHDDAACTAHARPETWDSYSTTVPLQYVLQAVLWCIVTLVVCVGSLFGVALLVLCMAGAHFR